MLFFSIQHIKYLFLLVVACIFSMLFTERNLLAHSPHDPIDALELSSSFDEDKTLFVAIGHYLLRSNDGGFSWKELVNGLDNNYHISSIAISSSFLIDRTLFVSTKGDGIYRSNDGGASWVKVNNGLENLNIDLLFVLSLNNVDRILLAATNTGGLFKTKNEGASWYQVIDSDTKITAIALLPDQETDHLIIGDQNGNLYFSVNGGETWQKHYQFPNSGAITSIAPTPSVPSETALFLGTEKRGVFKTIDGGSSFIEVNNGLSDRSIIDLAISPEYESDYTIFASSWNEAVFISNDHGNTWIKYSNGVTTDPQADTDEYKSPHFRNLRVSGAFAKDRAVFLGGFDGLFLSTDGGRNWIQTETLPVRLIKGMALSSEDRDHSAVAITTYGGGAYITNDQGQTWTVINRGLLTTRLSDIVFSPNFASDHTLFSASMRQILRTDNAGETWDKYPVLRKKTWRTRLYSGLRRLGFSRGTIQEFLGTLDWSPTWPTVIAVSPDFSDDDTLFFGTRRHGIYRSVNGGKNSLVVWDGMGRIVTSLVMSPDFSSDGTLFVGLCGAGVYKTIDNGDTWRSANQGLSFVDTLPQAGSAPPRLPRKGCNLKILISPDFKTDNTLFLASLSGLFKTTDAGISWRHLQVAPHKADCRIIGLAISPNFKTDQTLIVSIRGVGLFKSDNGGTTFSQIGSELIRNNYSIELIEFSEPFLVDNTIYGASDEEIFQSLDGGNTWKLLKRPVRYENHREVVYYTGNWDILKDDAYSASSICSSNIPNDKATLFFVGTGVSWIGTMADDQGIARVYIDGKHMADIDQFNSTRRSLVKLYSIADLPYGPHITTVEISNKKNPKSSGYRIEIDAFDILP